ncbi:DEAD/DEAH box helicase [Microcoleus sp. FACHB-68]|uniref:DEAD/DEAH box helicase n=1 Tax=Microcoleus sp. FACHB-68 TaxID=2692826 RepID=UPI00168565BB|nr:DEAD/DEAH box helicase [Microcoleus sp. FACHB-68]MBD1940598.1 DEAD/DEAH box helicase [Microcoleus sp. FACHB-68]
MAILHGSWLIQPQGGCLFIWGEVWRRMTLSESPEVAAVLPHPLAMAPAELTEFIKSLKITAIKGFGEKGKSSRWESLIFSVPTRISETGEVTPQHSAATPAESEEMPVYLYPWQVEGLCLDAVEAMQFLQALPLGSVSEEDSFLGADLRFWSHLARWSLDLRARCKFLPALQHNTDNSAAGTWQPLLDSAADQGRLERFLKQMPAACRTYQVNGEWGNGHGAWGMGNGGLERETTANSQSPMPNSQFPIAVNLPTTPQELLWGFLQSTIDAQVRQVAKNQSVPAFVTPLREWLQALGSQSAEVKAPAMATERLEATLKAWMVPVQHHLAGQQLFRTYFSLHPPAAGEKEWILAYGLQAADDPTFVVDAKTIWSHPVERFVYQGRIVEQPQETLLRGLGVACRLNAAIEPSLEEASPQFCRLTPLQAYEFLKSGAWRFEDSGLGVILPASLSNREGWASRLGLSIRAETPKIKKTERLGLQSLLSFKWELTIGGQNLSKAEFERLVKLNSPLVEINGEWVELRPQDVKAAQNFFTSRKDQMELSLEDALRLGTGDSQMIEKLPVVSFEAGGKLEELFANLTTNRAPEAIATPESFRGELRPYQSLGAGWLAFLEQWGLGACLADDMGLGKTVQTIAFLLHLQEQDALESPVLLVCPTSVLGNWEREVKKFGPTLKVMVHHGDKRAKGKAFASAVNGKNLVITSYPLVYRDAKDLQSVSWQGVVLDEAQNIKNSEAKQSQAVRQLETQFRIALTGTPVENRLQELWSILDFLNPGYLGQRNFFQRRFAIPIEKYGDTSSLQTLRSLVQPFILRRLKTDRTIIQDLPEKQEMTVFCGLSAEQASLYQKLVDESLAEIESAEGIQRHGMILALLVKLKQVCNHPVLFTGKPEKSKGKSSSEGGKTAKLATNAGLAGISTQQSGKLLRLQEMLEEVLAEGDRALIFTQFAEWGKLLKPHLEKQFGREVLFLYGSTGKQQREEMIDRFQHDPQGPRIMILSLKAGGTGLNLTRANHVFHYDRWWNPAVENQATDRVFRIGQTRNVQVHKFVCNGTLEEKIHDIIESKKALADQVVGEGEQWLTQMDTDQLRNLLLLDRTAVIDEEGD